MNTPKYDPRSQEIMQKASEGHDRRIKAMMEELEETKKISDKEPFDFEEFTNNYSDVNDRYSDSKGNSKQVPEDSKKMIEYKYYCGSNNAKWKTIKEFGDYMDMVDD